MITPTNISSITKTRQTKHIENKAIIVTEVFGEVSKAATLKAVTVSEEAKTAADIIH
jgi:hypothetical protein